MSRLLQTCWCDAATREATPGQVWRGEGWSCAPECQPGCQQYAGDSARAREGRRIAQERRKALAMARAAARRAGEATGGPSCAT